MNGSIHGSPVRFQQQHSNVDIPSLEAHMDHGHHDPYDEEMGGGVKKKAPAGKFSIVAQTTFVTQVLK